MNKNALRCAAALLACLILVTGSAVAQEEWQDLFDGKTFNGWVQRGGKAEYHVEDGCIVGTSVLRTPNSFMCTEKHYSDFILELEFLVDPRMNSGIQIRSNSFKKYKRGQVHGYQVEIDPDVKRGRLWSGGIYEEGRRGWLFDLENNEAARKAFKPEVWNHYRIEAIGDSIKTWINGVPAADLKDSMTPSGFIGLQVHGTKTAGLQIKWRNIRIQDLKVDNMGAVPPEDAVVLIGKDGDLSNWRQPVPFTVLEDGVLEVAPDKGNLLSAKTYGDMLLHVEFNINKVEGAEGTQNAGNSGIYIQQRYEVQILDTHGVEKPAYQDCGALYKTKVPDVNAARPAGEWQVYDIDFQQARWDGKKKTKNAVISVIQNGKTIHDKFEIPNKTGAGNREAPRPGRLKLQDHGNPVKFRNVWLVEK